MIRFLFLCLMFGAPLTALGVEAEGKIVYKKEGALVERMMALSVPARGEGDIVLRDGEGSEWVASKRWSHEAFNQVTFNVVFPKPEGELLGMRSKLWFSGTYLRGDNKAVYYGNIYKVPEVYDGESGYVGGFYFEAPVVSD